MRQVSQLYTPPELEPGFRDYEPIQPEPGWKAVYGDPIAEYKQE